MINTVDTYQNLTQKLKSILLNPRFVFGLYLVIPIIAGLQKYFNGKFNNFVIFQNSVFHFFEHQNLYLEYPEKYFDVFLYNPVFAILFTPFAYLPLYLGIPLWCMFTALVLFWAIRSLKLPLRSELLVLYMILPDLVGSLQHQQTNPLIAAFIVMTFGQLEVKKIKAASIFPTLGFFIKGYGGIAAVFFIMKTPKVKSLLYLFISFTVLALLPLLFYSWDQFTVLYSQWVWSLNQEYNNNIGLSVMVIIKNYFYSDVPVLGVQVIALLVLMASMATILARKNFESVKYPFLANVLIWVVIFNQASEPPTYIIAVTGVVIWFVTCKKTKLDIVLFSFFFVLTVLAPSDILAFIIPKHLFSKYTLKALPCTLIWIKIQFELFFHGTRKNTPSWNQKSM